MNLLWELYSDYLALIVRMFELKLANFVLMPNHFHSIIRAPQNNLSEAMNYFMRETSKQIAQHSGRINQIYGGPYHKSCLDTERYKLITYKYVYRNPVEAGLCESVEAYKWSTLSGLLGATKLSIPLEQDTILFKNVESTLKWLNWSYQKNQKDLIRKALKKGLFNFSKRDCKNLNDIYIL